MKKIKQVNLPGSKSITNRVLLLASTIEGTSYIENILISDDTSYMLDSLIKLGFEIETQKNSVKIKGKNVREISFNDNIELFVGNAGTTIRFLTTFLTTFKKGKFIINCEPRMKERPIADLVDPLNRMGAKIKYLEKDGYPPLLIEANNLSFEEIEIDVSKSSQYLSSILLNSHLIGVKKIIAKNPVSIPYIETSLKILEYFGIRINTRDYITYTIEKINLKPQTFYVPADASSASYFFAGAFLLNKLIGLNIGKNCMQGDYNFIDILRAMGGSFAISENMTYFLGRERFDGIEVDMNSIPDVVQTLSVLALFADTPTTIKNVENLRIKETDRLEALQNELTKIGATVITGKDFINIKPAKNKTYYPVTINTYNDHRMAMSFAIAQLKVPIKIENPSVVSKSFPEFWEVWEIFLKD
ncbi:MAG TPA: 3-phosphoshikimate 1-carboxyvinyltransferase [Spirochaetota bacterium]|nr:3-phosphoshikimate 1-carboxyvinyltransferase [Spirochaetota bacterium]HPQ49700.1 3-phosphoshikimate 1-carboxyvinyltransferase [Spirochaetota bacterium]